MGPIHRFLQSDRLTRKALDQAAWLIVREAYEALDVWLTVKLSLQNAGVNNPSLDVLKKNEPSRYQEYQAKLKAPQEKLK